MHSPRELNPKAANLYHDADDYDHDHARDHGRNKGQIRTISYLPPQLTPREATFSSPYVDDHDHDHDGGVHGHIDGHAHGPFRAPASHRIHPLNPDPNSRPEQVQVLAGSVFSYKPTFVKCLSVN